MGRLLWMKKEKMSKKCYEPAAVSHRFIRQKAMDWQKVFREKVRKFILSSLFGLFVVLIGVAAPLSAAQTKKNVLLITIDTLRADRLSCYSREHVQTPNIDKLAERGVLFSRAFANTSTTLPSHANILLGVSPLYHGVHDNLHFVVREEHLSLAEHLKNNGYATAAFVGAYPLDPRFGLDQGFDIYDADYPHDFESSLPSQERRAEEVMDSALAAIETLNSPWFVWIHCYDPHLPYEPPEPYKSRFENSPYDGEVAYVDDVFGKLVDYLETQGLFDEAMIVLTADHGESLGQHGETSHGFYAYNTTIWVPLIIDVPGLEEKQVHQYVSHLDIFPTVCEFAGVKKPSQLQGRSLLPVMQGARWSENPIYFESLYPYYSHGWAPLRGIIHERKKFVDSPIPEIYDLEKDFDESSNLAGSERRDEYLRQLEKLIRDQSSPQSIRSHERFDREVLDRLSSLGYVSRSPGSAKEDFGPQDDVKTLLPFHNQVFAAMTLYGKGRIADAIDMLNQVIQKREDIGIAYCRLGLVYMNEGQTDKSLDILRRGLYRVPGDYDVYRSYIQMLRRAQRFDEIVENFHEQSYPEISFDPEIWNELGFAYANMKDWDKALESYDRALSLDSKFAEAFYNKGNAYLTMAIDEKNVSLVERSVAQFQRAVDVDANYPSPYYGLGRAYRIKGDIEAVIRNLTKAVELRPDFDASYYYLGLTYLDKGEKLLALECFVTIKEKFFSRYSEEQKNRIDELIKKCKD